MTRPTPDEPASSGYGTRPPFGTKARAHADGLRRLEDALDLYVAYQREREEGADHLSALETVINGRFLGQAAGTLREFFGMIGEGGEL